MAKLRTISKNKNIGKLKIVIENLLQKSLLLGKKSNPYRDDCEDYGDSDNVPDDVKEGHFAVIAMDGKELPKRFVIPLSYLTHPKFLRLLEQAAEEYGFDHEGALAIPCQPSELESILADHHHVY